MHLAHAVRCLQVSRRGRCQSFVPFRGWIVLHAMATLRSVYAGCARVFTIVNHAAVHVGARVLGWTCVFISLGDLPVAW